MPGLLPASELASIRSDAASAVCDTSCDIQRETVTPGSAGEPTGTYNTIATVNVGMSQPSGSQLQNFDYLIGSLKTWVVQFPVGTDVRKGDHLVIEGQTLVAQVDLSPQSYNCLTTFLACEVQ